MSGPIWRYNPLPQRLLFSLLVPRNRATICITILPNQLSTLYCCDMILDRHCGPLLKTQAAHLWYKSWTSCFRLTQKNVPWTISRSSSPRDVLLKLLRSCSSSTVVVHGQQVISFLPILTKNLLIVFVS